MSHHYGEDAVKAFISGGRFTIIIQNHETGAQITVEGPVEGVFEKYKDRRMNQSDAAILGNEIAHLLRRVL
jgi:hypothetical protein